MPASPTAVTASAYVLPGAVSLNSFAFGDEPIVIYRSERLRWVNADQLTHRIVADSPDATDFRKTDDLPPNGGEQSFSMTRLGTTRIHCTIHPSMTGTLIVDVRDEIGQLARDINDMVVELQETIHRAREEKGMLEAATGQPVRFE